MRHALFVVFLFPACVYYLYIFRLSECHSFDCSGIAPAFFLGAVGPNRARRLICDAQRGILCHSCRFYACTFYATEALFAERTFRFFVRYDLNDQNASSNGFVSRRHIAHAFSTCVVWFVKIIRLQSAGPWIYVLLHCPCWQFDAAYHFSWHLERKTTGTTSACHDSR